MSINSIENSKSPKEIQFSRKMDSKNPYNPLTNNHGSSQKANYNEYGMAHGTYRQRNPRENNNALGYYSKTNQLFVNSKLSSESTQPKVIENGQLSGVSYSNKVLVTSNGKLESRPSKKATTLNPELGASSQGQMGGYSNEQFQLGFSAKTRQALPHDSSPVLEMSTRNLIGGSESYTDPKKYEVSILEATTSQPLSINKDSIKNSQAHGTHDASQAFYLPKRLLNSDSGNRYMTSTGDTSTRQINTIGIQSQPLVYRKMQHEPENSQKTTTFVDHRFSQKNSKIQREYIKQQPQPQEMKMPSNDIRETTQDMYSHGNTQSYSIGINESLQQYSQVPGERILSNLQEYKPQIQATNFEGEIQEHPDHVDTFNSSKEFKPSLTKQQRTTTFDQFYQTQGSRNANFSTEKFISLIDRVDSGNVSTERVNMEMVGKRDLVPMKGHGELLVSTIPRSGANEVGAGKDPSNEKDSLIMSSHLLSI